MTRTPASASHIGRPARPRQPPPQPPADQHQPHTQSSAASPASTNTTRTSSLSGTSDHQGPQDQLRPPLPWQTGKKRARRGRGPTPMRHTCCVGWFGTSTTATATPSAKAACPGASSSARTWPLTACRPWRTGCGRKGFAFHFQQRRWRTWTRLDRPGEGLRPDGIEEDENSNEYPSGASINVSMWDMIEKNFPEPGSKRRLQGSSSASPGKEKRSAGDRKRDRKWREYQEGGHGEDPP